MSLTTYPQLFKRWIMLSTWQITIQWIAQLVSQILIHCIVIYLAPVVQTLVSAILRINHYPADGTIDFRNTCLIPSKVICPVDNAIQRLTNCGLADSTIQRLNNWGLGHNFGDRFIYHCILNVWSTNKHFYNINFRILHKPRKIFFSEWNSAYEQINKCPNK